MFHLLFGCGWFQSKIGERKIARVIIHLKREIITFREFLEIVYDEIDAGVPPVVPGWLARLLMVIPPFRRKADSFFKERIYDISRAVDILGYDPEVSTEEGLRRTVRYWKNKERACQK